jgi:D-alanine-D-alanine ligase
MQRNTARTRARGIVVSDRRTGSRIEPMVRSGLQQFLELLLDQVRLAVIFGGDKRAPGTVIYQSKNTRSWKSYEAVAEDIAASLRRCGFRHVDLIPEDMSLPKKIRDNNIHMAWLNTGGVQGCNSTTHAPAMLEMLGIPYVGHDPLNATTLDNKHAFKREAVCAGLPTAPFMTWHMNRGTFRPDRNSRFQQVFGDYRGPFVVKPVSGRASLHVHVVPNADALPAAIEEVFEITGNLVLIEKYLSGREFCIAVAGPITTHGGYVYRGREPFAFGALERVLAPDELIFTSMDSKPITTSRFKEVSPLESHLWAEMHRLAREVYLEFNLGSLIRLDMRTDENGKLHILEANPKPDLKTESDGVTSLVSAGLAQTNLSYDDLILSLFADRLDFLLRHRNGSMQHVIDLLPAGQVDLSEFDIAFTKLQKDTDLHVDMLAEKALKMGFYEA